MVTVTTVTEAEQRGEGPRVPERMPEQDSDLLIAGGNFGCCINS